MKEREMRCYRLQELRADDGSKGNTIEGHAVVFNQPTVIGDSFIEIIDPKALNGCDLSDVALFVNHDTSRVPLARTQSGTLKLSIDNIGLAIRAMLDTENNPEAKALWHSIVRGDIRGMSFAFTVDIDDWQNLNSDMPTRVIKKFKKLYEVSAVAFPAYDSTNLQARARQMITNAQKEKNRMTNYDRELLLKHGFDPDEKNEDERYRNLAIARNREADYVNEERARARYNAEAPFSGFATEQDQRDFIITGLGGTAPYPKSQRRRDLESRFIPVREGNRRILDLATETRGQLETAGQELCEKHSVQSPFNIFGDRRAMTLETNLIVPQYSSTTITPNFSMVSSLVEAVAHLSLDGGESFSQPYISDIETGGYTKESENYHGAETRFNYAQINRTKITAYAELTEELEKLPAAAYADTVFQNIRTSIQKVLSREILFGEGVSTTDNQSRLVGIFSDKATAIDPTTDLSLSAITDTTLNEILYRYGGDEEVESPSCLLLNKYDLLSFANAPPTVI